MGTLKELPLELRPRERLLAVGPEQLADHELLAILLGTGTRNQSAVELAQALLHHCEQKAPGARLAYLRELRSEDLTKVLPGLGAAKCCQVLAAVHLGMRAGNVSRQRLDLNNPQAVFEYLSPRLCHLGHEQFQVILLNAKNRLIGVELISKGTLTASLVHPREIFEPAIRRHAHAVILAHNHPSGDPTPSREDRDITARLIQAGKLLGIGVLDHIVIGDKAYVSLRERGLADFA